MLGTYKWEVANDYRKSRAVICAKETIILYDITKRLQWQLCIICVWTFEMRHCQWLWMTFTSKSTAHSGRAICFCDIYRSCSE